MALYELGRDTESLAAFDAYLGHGSAAYGYRYRALLHARAGRAPPAKRNLEIFRKASNDPALSAAVAALVLLYLGQETAALNGLEEAVKARPADAGLCTGSWLAGVARPAIGNPSGSPATRTLWPTRRRAALGAKPSRSAVPQ